MAAWAAFTLALMSVAAGCAASPVLPTPAQLAYQRGEIVALTHFNMATFVQDGDPACNPSNWNSGATPSGDPATFNPTQLDTDNWVQSYLALGAKSAVLTAKHGCGFLLWPSNVTTPDGVPYWYSVGREASAYKGDVVAQFAASCAKAGLGHGFYYSLKDNYALNVPGSGVPSPNKPLPGQKAVTQAQYKAIVSGHLAELWTQYGDLSEIWFDGGYIWPDVVEPLLKKQPGAVAFGGSGASPSPTRWVGTESGMPTGPLWSTGCSGNGGDPNATMWCPATCDTTLQVFDKWFYTPGLPIRDLGTLITVYHDTVGQNGVLELDFAIDREGRVNATHAARYKQFGDWIRACYGSPLQQSSGAAATLTLSLASPMSVDRVQLREDISKGELVRAYVVEYQATTGGAWQPFSTGTAVGNRKIDVLGAAVTATAVRLTVTQSVGTPNIAQFAVFKPCPTS